MQLQRFHFRFVEINRRNEIVVPGAHERKYDLRRKRGFHHGQHDHEKLSQVPRTFDLARLEQLGGNALHVLNEKERHERGTEKVGNDQRPQRAHGIERLPYLILRQHQRRVRDHHAAQKR